MEPKRQVISTSEELKNQKRKRLRRWLGWILIVVSLVVVSIVLYVAMKDDMPDNFGDFFAVFPAFFPKWKYLIGAIGVMALAAFTAMIRFNLLIHANNGRWYPKDSLRVHIIGKYYDFITPYSLGGEPYQIYHLRKCHLTSGQASSVTIIYLYTSRLAFLVVSLALFIAFPMVVQEDWVRIVSIIGALLTTLFPVTWMSLTFSRRFSNKIERLLHRLIDRFAFKKAEKYKAKISYFVAEYKVAIATFKERKDVFFIVIPLAIIGHLASLAVPYFAIMAVPDASLLIGPDSINLFQILAECMYAVNFTAIIPTPGGIGGAEFSFASIFSTYVSGSYLLWAMLIWRFLTFYLYILVGLTLVIISAGFKKRAKNHPKVQTEKLTTFQFIDNFYPLIDGVVKVVDNYAIELNKRDYQTTVIAPSYHKHDASKDRFSYRVIRAPSRRFKSFEYDVAKVRVPRKVKKAILYQEPVLLHAHAPFFVGHYALKLAKKYDLPLIATFHSKFYDDFYMATRSKLLSKLALKYVISFFRACDEVWTVSEYAAGVLRDYGYHGVIKVMPNGTHFHPRNFSEEELAHFAEKHHIDRNKKNLLFVGHLIEQKNIRMTIKTFKKLYTEDKSYALTIVGSGGHEKQLHQYAERIGVKNVINWVDGSIPLDDLQAVYTLADLFFFPSLYETFSIVLREAAVMKTAALVAAGGATAEAITDGENGFIATADVNSLCAKIIEIFSDPVKLQQAGEKAAVTIPLSWPEIIDDVVTNYERVVEEFHVRLQIKE
ncbi:MAG: flippase-like domain-containing protein [Bacilli bacterium]